MILRRFREHIKSENWFAVSVDFFVVVVGIFVGLQVSEWNESRKDRVEERQYIERLHGDMVASIDSQRGQIQRLENITQSIEEFMIAVRDGSLDRLSPEEIEGAFARMGAPGRPLTRMGTIEELQAAGKFQILEDIEIRNALSELQQSYIRAMDILGNLQTSMAMAQHDLGRFFEIAPEYVSGMRRITSTVLVEGQKQNHQELISGLTLMTKFNKILLNELHRHHANTKSVESLLRTSVETGR